MFNKRFGSFSYNDSFVKLGSAMLSNAVSVNSKAMGRRAGDSRVDVTSLTAARGSRAFYSDGTAETVSFTNANGSKFLFGDSFVGIFTDAAADPFRMSGGTGIVHSVATAKAETFLFRWVEEREPAQIWTEKQRGSRAWEPISKTKTNWS